MAVHLNARLKTRFIPFLFTVAVLASAFVAIARANQRSLGSRGLVSRSELRQVMSEGVDPRRVDRRPGFSKIIYAPRVGERPTVGAVPLRTDGEPAPNQR